MGRIDKYDPKDGGFRAPLAADHAKTSAGNPLGVGLDSSGRVVMGAGNTGVIGLLALTSDKKAGDIVDVMTDGEMVEMVGLTAGTLYYAAAADGVLSTTNTGTKVGATVEATRLVVRMGRAGATQFTGEQANIVSLDASLVAGATGNDALQAIPDPANTPADADALRDDLVANALPAIRNNFADVTAKINTILATLDAANVTA